MRSCVGRIVTPILRDHLQRSQAFAAWRIGRVNHPLASRQIGSDLRCMAPIGEAASLPKPLAVEGRRPRKVVNGERQNLDA
jgi:hypothetical protein